MLFKIQSCPWFPECTVGGTTHLSIFNVEIQFEKRTG